MLGSVSAGQLGQALSVAVACVQNLCSVIDRPAEPVLDRCRQHGVAWPDPAVLLSAVE